MGLYGFLGTYDMELYDNGSGVGGGQCSQQEAHRIV